MGKTLFLIALFVSIGSLSVVTARPVPAATLPRACMVLDKGGKDDKSFNQSAVQGFERALKELPFDKGSKFVEPRSDSQIPLFFQQFVKGCDLIISIGFNPSSYLPPIAARFPEKKFLVLDTSLEDKNRAHNIRSVTFAEEQGSFLIGAIAAMKTKSRHLGFIGGMDVPIVHHFLKGYEAGAHYVDKQIKVTASFIGVTPDAWNNPAKAREIALSQYQSGIDVIFQVASASGQGVFDAAEQIRAGSSKRAVMAIGVDSNQNAMSPTVLTSMEKRLGHAIYETMSQFVHQKFEAEHVVRGLKEGGVDWSYDKYNAKYFTPSELEKIKAIKQGLIDGSIHVLNSDT